MSVSKDVIRNYIKHFKTVCKHKAVVFRECKACGIAWQGIIHDISKFGLTEFTRSAKYFQGDRSPVEAEKEKRGYSIAWQHHKGHNPHHWEYWIDFASDGSIIANEIPYKYTVEMVCDFVGAGIAYSGKKWTKEEPLNYYNKVKDGRYLHPKTKKLFLELLECINDKGLDEFHKIARERLKIYKGE